ncbi:hypothetical protein CGCS363_v006191 [Colletotrichum siamense]|uniref:uncharacterized protein n=1 Tax=Colletotrichum siamense TaxID=690259 RepID=UPI00187333CF|nr:uncharacterized protein CGCS363_v006191 [Colletotrichum siamense]KAF5501123.1 hypothetical protein CGCS363_v006191 [Colletotrichum siamense]
MSDVSDVERFADLRGWNACDELRIPSPTPSDITESEQALMDLLWYPNVEIRTPSPNPSTNTNSDDVQHDQPSSACIICGELETTRKCALCNDVLICSMNCQEVAVRDDVESRHFTICVSKIDTSVVLRTAKTLYKDVLSNKVPSDIDTINDYHFHWFDSSANDRKFLKMYVVIIGTMDVTAHELDLWVKEGKLLERIAMLFHSSPKLVSLEDLMWLKDTRLWSEGLSKTARAIFKDIIARKQKKRQ